MLLTIFGILVCCLLVERLRPGWPLPQVRTWPLRMLLLNGLQLGLIVLAGVTWERWFSSASLFHLSTHVPAVAGGLLTYFVATFFLYWWHRWRHQSPFLWRALHQIHHSPQRIEVVTTFYKHPAEMLVNSLVGSLLVYTVLGLSIEAGGIYTIGKALGEFFYHTNIKTPRWVGFFFQRPEMHRIHHQYRHHRNNYGDITWWDMLFGTYLNPRDVAITCGFDDAREQQFLPMLAGRDVHAPETDSAAATLPEESAPAAVEEP